MKRSRIPLYLLSFFVITAFNTLWAQELYINIGVDTADGGVKSVIDTWNDYISTADTIGMSSTRFWNAEEQRRWKNYDFLALEYARNWYKVGKQTVLSVKHIEDGLYRLRIHFYTQNSGPAMTAAIVNYYAREVDGEYVLENALGQNTADWREVKTKYITYHFPSEHRFDTVLAGQMNIFIDSLADQFDIDTTKRITFFFADSWEDMQRARGLDFYLGEGGYAKPQGVANHYNAMVFSGRGSEWYPHEIVHLYLMPIYDHAGTLHEGIATFLGGHLGKDLEYHYRRIHAYLTEHPEKNLNDLFGFHYMDQFTNPLHVISGLFIEMAYERGGMESVKKMLREGERYPEVNSRERYYRVVEDILGISRVSLNSVIRSELERRASSVE